MSANYPRLYSLSTVCLLKHYNQDYLLHELRTDFTGSNGVGKSIIADLFQIVFVADTRHIKFATEGIDKKGRKIDKLPYESGVGYVFFNVEVSDRNFITIGAAIFSQGNNLIKPFIITANIALENEKLDQSAFKTEKLLFSKNFLKPGKEPFALDELARTLPDTSGLYLHYFSHKDEKNTFYDWLYKNEILPINLVKEGNIKAFAKVIQSFSKSRALEIDNSKSLIEYLFEEDEVEISQEYHHQEQAIKKLLYQFSNTKSQIKDIGSKQTDLLKLRADEIEKQSAEHNLDYATYIKTQEAKNKKQNEFDKLEKDIQEKQSKLASLKGRSSKFLHLVQQAQSLAEKEKRIFTDLAGKQNQFAELDRLQHEEQEFISIDTDGLMHAVPDQISELLKNDARFFKESIRDSRDVLKRYATVRAMEKKKEEQDLWLKSKLRAIEDQDAELQRFQVSIKEAEKNNLFVNALTISEKLTKAQQAILLHLRGVALAKPYNPKEGTRYTDAVANILNLKVEEDSVSNGWWIQTGPLYEFVPESSLLLPDFSTTAFTSIEQLKNYLDEKQIELRAQKAIFESLQKGLVPETFLEYEFDVDLSDNTKLKNHTKAAHLCALINHKVVEVKRLKEKEIEDIEEFKRQYGITTDGIEYHTLLKNTEIKSEHYNTRYNKVNTKYIGEKSSITSLEQSLPYLERDIEKVQVELNDGIANFATAYKVYAEKYPDKELPESNTESAHKLDINALQKAFNDAAVQYMNKYNQIVGKYDETKDRRDLNVNAQVDTRFFSFRILEQALLGNKIGTLDDVTTYLENLNTELLHITDELLENIVKVFGKTEMHYDRYKRFINSLNEFFKGKLISNRFYFKLDFNPSPKLDIKWIEYLRKSTASIASTGVDGELTPQQFIEDAYMRYSGNKSRIDVEDLLNPKRYFVLKGKMTDENEKENSGSTGESYTAIALLGIARLSVVQDGDRVGLRFIILEESATLDNVNFSMFPKIAKEYGYQIITMTPKPYAVGDEDGWFIHQLIPGKGNKDINYPKVMSYFRTNKSQMELESYLKARQ